MVLIFSSSDFRGRYGYTNQLEIEDFIDNMDTLTRVYQFAYDTAPDCEQTECKVVRCWHGQGEDHHFTCRLSYVGYRYQDGVAFWTVKKYGTLHVYKDGSETRRGGKIWYP